MCGTEQSKEAEEGEAGGFFDNMWNEFVRDEKFDHEEMAHIHADGKCLKAHENKPFDLSSIIKGKFGNTFGVKKEADKMEDDSGTYVPAIFKGFIKNIESKEVNSLFIFQDFNF